MTKPDYHTLANHYEDCLKKHGATAQGVDWPNEADMKRRFDVMLGIATDLAAPLKLLDLGCGYGALYDHLVEKKLDKKFDYRGIDLSGAMIEAAKQRHPKLAFTQADILKTPLEPQGVDITIMNGLLTEKREMSFDAMEAFAVEIIGAAYDASCIGVAFNVMSTLVDYQREDLFHWPFDRAAALLKARCSRHMTMRADYGLYEYTVYLFREPMDG